MMATNKDAAHLADVLAGVVRRAVVDAHCYESRLPHLLVCADPEYGFTSYSGPFRSRLAAEVVAQHERRGSGPDSRLIFYAAPLYPPLDLAALARLRTDRRADADSAPAKATRLGIQRCCPWTAFSHRSEGRCGLL